KAVMCDHSNIVFVASSVIGYLEHTSADTILNVLPLSSGYGLYQPRMTFTFPGTLIHQRSYAYPAATSETIAQERATGPPGVPTPGTEVWIAGPEGERLGDNQVGELVVRGRHVMRGYWRAPEATASRFRPGPTPGERVCYTGDLFRMDEEGYMYFVGRKDDI